MLSLLREESRQAGFTIVELLVTALFVGIAFLAIGNLMVNTINLNRRAGNLIEANLIAQQKIENYRQTSYGDIPVGSPAVTFTGELPGRFPAPRSATINVTEVEAGLKKVDVFITYTDGGTRNVEQSTYITEAGISR